ncbi:MAG: LytTR family DNA-binding domain-containing protein [Bacteroidota bacterium]
MWSKYLGKYKDGLLCLVLIPVINTINYHLTYAHIRWDWYTYTTYAIDTASGFICWWLVRKITDHLDKRVPYETSLPKRLTHQIVWTTLIVLGFIILSTEVVNALFGDGPLPRKFYTYNLFIFFIWILVINAVYIGMYFYDEWKETQKLRDKDKQLRDRGFEVVVGNQLKMIAFEKIAHFYSDEGSTYLHTINGHRYVLDDSLNKIMPKLPEEFFFRLNRKYIVHRDRIDGYKKEVNGKLAVRIRMDEKQTEQIVSRTTAPQFKRWFRPKVQQL